VTNPESTRQQVLHPTAKIRELNGTGVFGKFFANFEQLLENFDQKYVKL